MVTEVTLSDNAQEAPISGPTQKETSCRPPEALDTNVTVSHSGFALRFAQPPAGNNNQDLNEHSVKTRGPNCPMTSR